MHCDERDDAEASRIRRFADHVYRDTLGLHLRLRSGTFALFADDTSEGSAVHYTFHAYIADLDYYLVHQAYYEGRAEGLINEHTGQLTTVEGVPCFSPNRLRFVVAMVYDNEVFPPSAITVYQVDTLTVTQEWRHPVTGWSPSNPVWLSDTVIRIDRQDVDTSEGLRPVGPVSTVTLRRASGEWKLNEP